MSSSTSRRAILDRIRSRTMASPELPDLAAQDWIHYEDVETQFLEMVATVGGACTPVASLGEIGSLLTEQAGTEGVGRILSAVPEAMAGNVGEAELQSNAQLASLDWVVVRGAIAVAENGAVWIPGSAVPRRAALFLTQYLAIVVDRRDIVPHMHAAYERIGRLSEPFGVFISGPSKTADIEQSLVLGAHGCRSLRVFVLQPGES